MASFLSRLFSRLKSRKKDGTRSRHRARRQLGLERMEGRRLLAGDLGAIEGTIFTDLTDNATIDVGDPLLSGATVHLYKDGGNGTNESTGGVAGGDDSLVGSTTTNASGVYRFDGLDDGTFFVESAPVTGQLQRPASATRTVVISATDSTGTETLQIDSFDTVTTPDPLDVAPGATGSDQVATVVGPPAEALGNERDVFVSNDAGSTSNIQFDVTGGQLIISAGNSTTGDVAISYDGVDAGGANTISFNTLNGGTPVDLTASNGEAFHFRAGSQSGSVMTVTVFSSATNFSTASNALPITAGGTPNEDLIMRFSSFAAGGGGPGADFTSVTAILVEVAVAAADDPAFDFIRIVSPFVTTENFAHLNPMSFGNLVFRDPNNNGTVDAGDTGIQGVDVQLYEDTNGDNAFDAGDTLLNTVTTDASGLFLFDNLFPGDYIALIPISEFATNADPLFGFATSTGNDPAPDPDVSVTNDDDNGALVAGIGVATAAVTLASGTEPTNDGDSDTNSDLTVDFGFVPEFDLQVTKSAAPTTVTAGNQLTYTITVTNNGNADAANVVVTDDLPNLSPDALTIDSIVSSSGNGTPTQTGNTSGEIEVAYASLAAGASDTITITVTVPSAAAAAAVITNTASVTGDGTDTNPANDTDTADVAVTRSAVLTLTKTDTPDPAAVGATLTYDIVVTNTGPSTATNVVVTDNIPTGLNGASVSTTGGTGVTSGIAGGVMTANIPSLAVNESVTVTITATIDSAFSGSTIPNSATATADEASTVQANADTTINPQVDLAITKADDADPVNRGAQLTYTLTVTNNGPSTANNVQVVDTLPAGVTYSSGSSTVGTVTAPSGGSSDVTIDIASLAASASATITIVVDVGQSAAASLSNTAVVSSDESTNGFDTDTNNNSVTETTAVQSSIDLGITKSDDVDPAVPGQALTYTLTVTNTGPSDAGSVLVTDDLPDGIQITSASSTVGTVNIPASAQDTTSANPDNLTVDVGSLAVGATATVTINATVLSDTRGTLSNVASVSSTDSSMIDTNSANDSATETTALTPSVDVAVTKSDSIDPATAGNSLTYTVVVTNNGPSTATNVVLTDTLPSGVTFSSASTTAGSTPTESSGVVTANIGTLAPSASATVTIVVDIDAATRGSITNTASVTSTENDSNATNNSATADTTINGSIDLAITKTDSTDPAIAGGTVSYTITVTNTGPSTATNVIVTDAVPSDLTVTSVDVPSGTNNSSGNNVSVNLGTIAPNASATITVNATVSATATGTISNTASVDGAETDSNTANNSTTETTQIAELASLAGSVYFDTNGNGVRDTGEDGIAGVAIALSGTDDLGNPVNQSQTTDANGDYLFTDLVPGTYTLTQTQPEGLGDGQTSVGTGATGTAGTNEITTIDLNSGANAAAFNFGETRSALSKRRLLASGTEND